MSNHTPSPWILNIDTVHIREGVNVQPVTHHMDAVGMADARLIAAAPELLSNLENLIRLSIWKSASDYDRAQVQLAIGAVQKAKGQTSE